MIECKPNFVLQRIFDIRRFKKITLKELGACMGVNHGTASQIENGAVPITLDKILSVCKRLGIEPWALFIEDKAFDFPKNLTNSILSKVRTLDADEILLISKYRKIRSSTKKRALLEMSDAFA